MLTINKLIPRGQGLAPVLLKRASSIELDWDVRQKSRFDATDAAGRHLGVFLPRGTAVRGGDVLVAEDGALISVIAAAQPVMTIRACAEHGSPFDLVRAAYHLGNRHVQIELRPEYLRIEPDPVLAQMLRRMHLIVSEENAPFEPEAGAYQGGGDVHHRHGHGHDHDHGHGQEQAHDHDHDHDHDHHDHAQPHNHGHDDAHDHGDQGHHGHKHHP